jgi:hypothetical protein
MERAPAFMLEPFDISSLAFFSDLLRHRIVLCFFLLRLVDIHIESRQGSLLQTLLSTQLCLFSIKFPSSKPICSTRLQFGCVLLLRIC